MLAFAIDPTSGARSAIGIAVADLGAGKIISVREIKIAPTTDLRKRIKLICAALAEDFKDAEKLNEDYLIFIESTVMMGKGGESLQRAIGAMLAVSPSHRELHEVSNMQVKLFVGGTGKADKRQVAEGLKKFFPNSKDTLFNLIASSRWDSTDALAIAVTGMEKYVYKKQIKSQTVPKAKSRKTVKKSAAPGLGK